MYSEIGYRCRSATTTDRNERERDIRFTCARDCANLGSASRRITRTSSELQVQCSNSSQFPLQYPSAYPLGGEPGPDPEARELLSCSSFLLASRTLVNDEQLLAWRTVQRQSRPRREEAPTFWANQTRLPCRACDACRPSSLAALSWCAARWRLCFRECRAGPPYRCHVEQANLSQPSPCRNSEELSRGSRSALNPAQSANPTRRSRSPLPYFPTSSCGCKRHVWRLASFHLAGGASCLSCFQSQVNILTSRPRIVRCECWTRRARFLRDSYATSWKLSQSDLKASRSDSIASGKGDQR
ncbi:unnamed protein product [Trichogramma brassicae]|uniref:Uncharacterized protein n=1 Tax=Trichogramma brassicae TaxID=86971 RepID=A0A6H5I516_9HYME|nr:unnamed protein product [Trichogramma brassicae]